MEVSMIMDLASGWWNGFTRPWTPTFRNAISARSHVKTLLGVVAGAVLGAGASWLIHRLVGSREQDFMGLASVWVKSGTPAPFATWAVVVPLGVVYGFYSFEIVLFIFARLLGGKGSFGAQAFVQSLFYAPLAVVQQLFAVIPVVGRILFALVALYSLFPTTSSLKAAHGYSTSRAVLTWMLPILLNVVVIVTVVLLISRAAR
jgi:hypothetical protein